MRSTPTSREHWIAATVERFGRIDGLINNAGILRMVRFDEGDEAALDEMWSVNVMAPFRLIAAGPAASAQGRPRPDRQRRLDRRQALPRRHRRRSATP